MEVERCDKKGHLVSDEYEGEWRVQRRRVALHELPEGERGGQARRGLGVRAAAQGPLH